MNVAEFIILSKMMVTVNSISGQVFRVCEINRQHTKKGTVYTGKLQSGNQIVLLSQKPDGDYIGVGEGPFETPEFHRTSIIEAYAQICRY